MVGTCRAAIPRWSFNGDTGACEEFSYGGCNGSANNFESQSEYSAACLDSVDVCSYAQPPQCTHAACSMPMHLVGT